MELPVSEVLGAEGRTPAAPAGCRVTGTGLHELRHHVAVGPIAARVDVVAGRRMPGHGSASVTRTPYNHLGPSAHDRSRAVLAGLLRDLAGAVPGAGDPAD